MRSKRSAAPWKASELRYKVGELSEGRLDYQYRTTDELIPRTKDRDVVILLDRLGQLTWKAESAATIDSYSPTKESLRYFEDRFWTWCIYADSKIRRAELWEAREMIEYIGNNVVVRLACYANSLPFEGNHQSRSGFSRRKQDSSSRRCRGPFTGELYGRAA